MQGNCPKCNERIFGFGDDARKRHMRAKHPDVSECRSLNDWVELIEGVHFKNDRTEIVKLALPQPELEKFLDQKPDQQDVQYALCWYCTQGDLEKVGFVLQHGGLVNLACERLGDRTPLRAAMIGGEDVSRFLITEGADVTQPGLIYTAALYGHLGLCKLLAMSGGSLEPVNGESIVDAVTQRGEDESKEEMLKFLNDEAPQLHSHYVKRKAHEVVTAAKDAVLSATHTVVAATSTATTALGSAFSAMTSALKPTSHHEAAPASSSASSSASSTEASASTPSTAPTSTAASAPPPPAAAAPPPTTESKEAKVSGPPAGQIMLSYQWDDQKVIVRLKEILTNAGYKVWLDLEQMGGSTLEAMASAVEGSTVICVGASEKYKLSANCRLEAEYAQQQKKIIVPLMMQKGWRPSGWLGMLMGAKLYFDFSDTTAVEKKAAELMKELTRYITPGAPDETKTPSTSTSTPTPAAPPKQTCATWDEKKVETWLREVLTSVPSPMVGMDGVCLEELARLRAQDPSHHFISFLSENLTNGLKGALRLSKALTTL